MKDIENVIGSELFIKSEPIHEGWSKDRKYRIETTQGTNILRVTDILEFERKSTQFKMINHVYNLGVATGRPIKFGTCDQDKSVYSLFSWCDGKTVESQCMMMDETQQYVLGLQAGKILKQIHSLSCPKIKVYKHQQKNKINSYVEKYLHCGLKFKHDDLVLGYIQKNIERVAHRPLCFQHGDYHVGNMIVTQENQLSIIDFDRSDFGDPWEDFSPIVWSAEISPYFATGQLNGYFEGRPPKEFFDLLLFYTAVQMVSSICWALPFGKEEIDTMIRQTEVIISWYDHLKNNVPSWYQADFYFQYIDGIPYRLKKEYDFSFIRRYGRVFKIFDNQDSGNICFGVEKNNVRYFIKFAGAPTARSVCSREDAIGNLKEALPVYRDLAHKNLIQLIQDETVGGGHAAVFEWIDGECMGRMYPYSRQIFMSMDLETKKSVFEDILLFLIHVHKKGYVAIDFYDASIMYDFESNKTAICDIDFYKKKPYTNEMGRLWGSSSFMSPEEFEQGAVIDEVTNIFTIGAMAFALFSEFDRTLEAWPLGIRQYQTVKKAVHPDRKMRQQSIVELMNEWIEGKE